LRVSLLSTTSRQELLGQERAIHCGSILVVDDDAHVRTLIATVLGAVGHAVREASTGEEALAAAGTEAPSLVILDVCLPGLAGYSVLRDLRDLLGKDVPIVFISGERTDALDSASGLYLGADDYIVKPFHPEELLARVRRLLPRAETAERPVVVPVTPDYELTAREKEVLKMLASGLDQRQIARELVISEKTVETHIQRVLSKLGVHSRAQAVAAAHREGLAGAHDAAPDRSEPKDSGAAVARLPVQEPRRLSA
jgi:DNA-binding NarL/FixJ family response regulator